MCLSIEYCLLMTITWSGEKMYIIIYDILNDTEN